MPKITSAKTIVTCPGRNFITLKIETEGGVYGLGDAVRSLSFSFCSVSHCVSILFYLEEEISDVALFSPIGS